MGSAITISRSKKKTSLEIHFSHRISGLFFFSFYIFRKKNLNISVFITFWSPLFVKTKGSFCDKQSADYWPLVQQLPAPQLHQEQDDVQPRHNSFSIVKSDHIWNRSITPSALTCSKHGPQAKIGLLWPGRPQTASHLSSSGKFWKNLSKIQIFSKNLLPLTCCHHHQKELQTQL